jgi:hypothetical protein
MLASGLQFLQQLNFGFGQPYSHSQPHCGRHGTLKLQD